MTPEASFKKLIKYSESQFVLKYLIKYNRDRDLHPIFIKKMFYEPQNALFKVLFYLIRDINDA